MPKKLNHKLTSLAYDVVALDGAEKQINFGEGTDYQGELYLSWNGGQFEAYLTIFSDPYTSGGFFYDPPETQWREQVDMYQAVKIRDVADWLKRDWGFALVPETEVEP